MDDKERAMKVKMLQNTLKNDFGINSAAELLEAARKMTPVDISIFVSPPKAR